MGPNFKSELRGRLESHFATVRSSRTVVAAKRCAGNWQLYAAVTGSALAMATNAMAGNITYGATPVTAGPIPNVSNAHTISGGPAFNADATALIHLNNSASFRIGVAQGSDGPLFQNGGAFLGGFGDNVEFLDSGSSPFAKRLAKGAAISTSGPFAQIADVFYGRRGVSATGPSSSHLHPYLRQQGWSPSNTAFVGFRFGNSDVNYGWIQLQYTVGNNDLANSITVESWGYDSTGAPVTAGESPSAPEPSTAAMALLAAGAAGVLALRRRKSAVA